MKNFSEEVIEIDDKEYTLFVNRIGIVNWESATKLEETAKAYEKKYKTKSNEQIEFTDETDPFASDIDESELDKDKKKLYDVYSKFYWMALYKHHKLTIKEADDLFYKAIDVYGINQLAELAQQMISDANNQRNGDLKNLKALKSTK